MNEFARILRDLHRAQAEMAETYAVAIMHEAPTELLELQLPQVDHEAGLAFICAELEAALIHSVRVYTDWMASKLVRSKSLEKQPVPPCDSESLDLISRRTGVPVRFTKAFVKRLTRPGTKLPLVGEITADGELIPDKAALMKWATFFTW